MKKHIEGSKKLVGLSSACFIGFQIITVAAVTCELVTITPSLAAVTVPQKVTRRRLSGGSIATNAMTPPARIAQAKEGFPTLLRVLSICSGIGAAELAWSRLGWEVVASADIEAFPNAVREARFPDVPNWGDITKYEEWPDANVDVLVGGTPCQDFSVAGLRAGLDGDRGNLTRTFFKIAGRYRPQWVVWENVPGALSLNEGRDFGAILGAMGQLGYGWAYRVLDAQYFGVAQRRRRVFLVGCLGDWRRAAAVLFERESLSGHPAPRRKAGQGPAPTISARPTGGGGLGTDFELDGGLIPFGGNRTSGPIEVAPSLTAHAGSHGRQDFETETLVAANPYGDQALRGEGFDASEDGTGRGTPLVPVSFHTRQDPIFVDNLALPLEAKAGAAIAFDCKSSQVQVSEDGVNPTLWSMSHSGSHANAGGHAAVACAIQERAVSENPAAGPLGRGFAAETAYTLEARTVPQSVAAHMAVRRLTPRECERLQGFPDGFTAITYRGKPAADGPRYKALGNSMAVPVMEWIGRRIEAVEQDEKKEVA